MIAKALAVWRLTSLLVYEEGPGEIFVFLRDNLEGPLECFWCASVWVAGFFALVTKSNLIEKLVLWLSLSALAIFLDEARMRYFSAEMG